MVFSGVTRTLNVAMAAKVRIRKPMAGSDQSQGRSSLVNGDLLRAFRNLRGWTQQDTARESGVTDRVIRKAEAGGPIARRSIEAIAAALRIPAETLIEPELTGETVRSGEMAGEGPSIPRSGVEPWKPGHH